MKPIIAVPAICFLLFRAWSKNSLTPTGLVVAGLTAVAHAYHPWNLPFVLLGVFFLAGTRVTHIKEDVKSKLTMSSKGASGGEGPRTHVQVLANSLMASIFTVLHAIQLRKRKAAYMDPSVPNPEGSMCYAWGGDLLVIGIIANYAAVAADTFSSELGILSSSSPRLITSLTLRKVPRGTNGGVTLIGLAAGLLGSVIIVTASSLFLPICDQTMEALPGGGKAWTLENRRDFMRFMVTWGALGSVLDSILGGLFQRSVRDSRSGKIVEGEGGTRVLVSAQSAAAASSGEKAKDKDATQGSDSAIAEGDGPAKDTKSSRKASFGSEGPSRVVESGWDLLDNNDVNFLMAVIMSVGGMAAASWHFDIPIQSVMSI